MSKKVKDPIPPPASTKYTISLVSLGWAGHHVCKELLTWPRLPLISKDLGFVEFSGGVSCRAGAVVLRKSSYELQSCGW